MATDQVLLNVSQTQAVPLNYNVPPSAELALQSVRATFDGTGAAGSFLPALEIIGPGGIGPFTFVDQSTPISAGASADVTFGPFLRGAASTSGGGIQFDQNNVGDWLGIECQNTTFNGLVLQQDQAGGLVNLVSNANNSRIVLDANNSGAEIILNNNALGGDGGGVQISTDGNLDVGCGGVVDMTGHGCTLSSSGNTNVAVLASDGLTEVTSRNSGVIVSAGAGQTIQVNTTGGALEVNTDNLSFFGNVPVAQQSATTLAQVITALQNYGLLA